MKMPPQWRHYLPVAASETTFSRGGDGDGDDSVMGSSGEVNSDSTDSSAWVSICIT